MSCERRCHAETKNGSLCSRSASCKKGCKWFCWQHVEKYGGVYVNGECFDPLIHGDCSLKKLCKRRKKGKELYDDHIPCVANNTLIKNLDDLDDYCKIRGERPTGSYKRKKRRKKLKAIRKKATPNRRRVKNPKTGKMVYTDGKIGKEIMKTRRRSVRFK